MTGTVSWGGVPLTAGEASDLYMFESGSVGHYVDHADYELLNVSAGPHTVEIYGNGCTGPSGTKLGQQSFVVTAGATVDADFELAGSAGRVVGSVRVNGAPLANSLVQIVGGGVCTQNTMTDANGMFSRILPPGDFSAYLFSPAGLLRSDSFTIAVGKQEELADLDVQVGDVTGTLSWGGVPLTAGEASDLYMFEPRIRRSLRRPRRLRAPQRQRRASHRGDLRQRLHRPVGNEARAAELRGHRRCHRRRRLRARWKRGPRGRLRSRQRRAPREFARADRRGRRLHPEHHD